MNARESENYLAISYSSSASKSVEIFWAQSETRIACSGHVLLTNRDKMNIVYKGPSIDASYQVSVHLAKRFQRRRFF
jgi:hypothetical protein